MEIRTRPAEPPTSPPPGARLRPPLAPRSRPAPLAPPRGKIEVSARAIATVAGRATTECYGVVGIADRHSRFVRLEFLPPERYDHGVEVRFVQDHVAIELYVVLEYGLRISEIARNLIKDVKYAVERSLGLSVVEVNVNVQGLRVSDPRPGDHGAGDHGAGDHQPGDHEAGERREPAPLGEPTERADRRERG
jgi:uncharacterized alkaline shock family protein YloU